MTLPTSHPVTAFAPATVGNVICGFDVLGLALEAPGDRVSARVADGGEVIVEEIRGAGSGRLPLETDRNTAGAAARALLDRLERTEGVTLTLEKGLPLAGGMGGSAASAVAAVVAVDAALDLEASTDVLLEAALAGEEVASGSAHPDNAAPALLGGIVLSRPGTRRPTHRLPVPERLSAALLHPHLELETRAARAALGASVPLADAVAQWGNTAAFVAALYEGDLDLLADALEDRVAEPVRASGVPGFREVKAAAGGAGALACGLSGAGPSIVAFCGGEAKAREVGEAMIAAFERETDVAADLYLSPVARRGAHLVEAAAVDER